MKNTMLKTIKYAVYFKKQYDRHHIGAYSAEAAFFVLVSAVPLGVAAINLAGFLYPSDIRTAADFLSQMFSVQIREYIAKIFAEISFSAKVPVVSVSMIFLIVSATRGVRSIGQGIETIYECAGRYNILRFGLHSIVYTFFMFAVCGASAAVFVFASPVEIFISKFFGLKTGLVLTVLNMRNITVFILLTVLSAMAYQIFGSREKGFAFQLGGGAVAAAGWMIYSFGYSVYIRHFSKYSLLYGSLGAVMLFMLWLYMCMNILLCGALINKMRAE